MATTPNVTLFTSSSTSDEFQVAPTMSARAGTKVTPITSNGKPIQLDFWNETFTCPFHPRSFQGETRLSIILNLSDSAFHLIRDFEQTLRAFVTKHQSGLEASKHTSILRQSRDGRMQAKMKFDTGGRFPARIWTDGGRELRTIEEVSLDNCDIEVVAFFRGIWIGSDGQWGANVVITDMLLKSRTPVCPWTGR